MDHGHSQPSDAIQFIQQLRRTLNHNPKGAARVLEQNPQLRTALDSFLPQISAPANKTLPCMNLHPQSEQERLREELGDFLFDDSVSNEHLPELFESFLAGFEVPQMANTLYDEPAMTVENSPTDSMEIDPIISKHLHDANAAEIDCSAVTVPSPSLQTPLLGWPFQLPKVMPTPMNGRKKCALVIESNKSLSRMFTAFLKADHYLVRTANKSADALRLYRDCAPFEVVLIDYHMPKTNGVDIALDILKQDPTQPMIIVAPDYQTEDEVPRRKELINVSFLLDMSNLRKALANLQPWATREEVNQAITSLTTAQLMKLRKYADWRVCLSRGTDHRTGEDLLQEALCLTCEGAEGRGTGKRWNKRVPFFTHLIMAIRGITRRRRGEVTLWCDIFEYDAEGQGHSRLDTVASRDPTPDQNVLAAEIFDRLLGHFEDYPEDRSILQGLSEDMTKKQIVQEGGLSENQYRAALKRIRKKMEQTMQELGFSKNEHQEVVKRIREELLSLQNGEEKGENHDGQN
jgi:CheY-like chemotaxis protein/DNA-directed RNA polymerase specialized sigma24 family protein